jgi:hypothetical protein
MDLASDTNRKSGYPCSLGDYSVLKFYGPAMMSIVNRRFLLNSADPSPGRLCSPDWKSGMMRFPHQEEATMALEMPQTRLICESGSRKTYQES